jgi:signal transduction histidine kinase
MRGSGNEPFRSRLFYVGSIFAVSFGLVCLMWHFRTVNLILVAFGLAWVVLVTAFAWEVVTRAERLQAMVRSRTYALERSHTDLAALLEQLKAFHAISYEINQRTRPEEIARTFVDRLCTSLAGVDGAWVWLAPRLTAEADAVSHSEDDPVAGLELAARSGPDFGLPAELLTLRPDNPLTMRCFDGRSAAVDHNLPLRARAWSWPWLAGARMESFAGIPLQLGGELLGVLGIFSRRTVTADFVSRLHLSVNQLAVALEKARLLKETGHRADQLARANAELRQLDSMKDWFVSSVSHELRTPLTNIRSYGEILEQYEDLSGEERREFARVIRQESERLSDIIADLLDLAKIAAGEAHLAPECLDLSELVESCCEPFGQEAEERGIALEPVMPAAAVLAHADRQAVARVLHNLLGNAFKFTPDGGAIRIVVDALGEVDGSRSATVRVSDTGMGIPLGEQGRIFERFTQVGARLGDKPSGTGIGLAICREIVEGSGGRIWVDSRPGQGSTFAFTLPVAPAEADADQVRRVA